MKPTTTAIIFLAFAFIAALPTTTAAVGPFYTVEPSETVYREGSSLRVCATGHPDGQATHTFPDATTELITEDSNHCFAFVLTGSGLHTLAWTVATDPFEFRVETWSPTETDWTWWLNFTFLSLMLWYGFTRQAILVGAFAIIGIFAFIFEVVPFNFEELLALLMMAFALEWAANNWKLKK